jgi:predicted phage tail protein
MEVVSSGDSQYPPGTNALALTFRDNAVAAAAAAASSLVLAALAAAVVLGGVDDAC